MDNSSQLIQYVLSGLSNGAIYALIGFGFAIIHNATGILNFAQGEFVMLGGMFTIFILSFFNLPIIPAIALAIIFSTLVGILFERLAIRPLKNVKPLSLVIITIGASIFIRGAAMLIWGKTLTFCLLFPAMTPFTSMAQPLCPSIFGSSASPS
jgi:branched-chain amino acid transport system permease protein